MEEKPTQTPKRSVRRIASLPPHLRCESNGTEDPLTKKPRIVPSMSEHGVKVKALCSVLHVLCSLHSPSSPLMLVVLLPNFGGQSVGRPLNLHPKQLVKFNFFFLANPDTHLPFQASSLQGDLVPLKVLTRLRHRANLNFKSSMNIVSFMPLPNSLTFHFLRS